MKFLLQKSKQTSKVRTQNGMSPSLLPLQLSQRPHRGSKHLTTILTPPPYTHTHRLLGAYSAKDLGKNLKVQVGEGTGRRQEKLPMS